MTALAALAERVYVVHHPRLRERRAPLEAALAEFGWTAEWVTAREPNTPPPGGLRPAEVSAYLTHHDVLAAIARHRVAGGFVLEDDALFPADFPAVFARHLAALPPDFHLAYFGASCGYEVPPASGNPYFGRERGTRSMSGVLVTPHAAAVLAAELAGRPITAPIDLTVNEIVRARELIVYWSVPALIANGSETGRFPHSLGVRLREPGWRGRLARAVARWRAR